jgi:hypothetical protein
MTPKIIYAKPLAARPTLSHQLGRGDPCKKGETAKNTGCVPGKGAQGKPKEAAGVAPEKQAKPQEEQAVRAAEIRQQAEKAWGGHAPGDIEDALEDLKNDIQHEKNTDANPDLMREMDSKMRVAKVALKVERQREARSDGGWRGKNRDVIQDDLKRYKAKLEYEKMFLGMPATIDRLEKKVKGANDAIGRLDEKDAAKESKAKEKEQREEARGKERGQRERNRENKAREAYRRGVEKRVEQSRVAADREQAIKDRQEEAQQKAEEREASPQGAIDRVRGEHAEKYKDLAGKTKDAIGRVSEAIKSKGQRGASREIEAAVAAHKELNQHRRDMAKDIKSNKVGNRVAKDVHALEKEGRALDRLWDRLPTRSRRTQHGWAPRGKTPRGVKEVSREVEIGEKPGGAADWMKKAATWAQKTWAERQAGKVREARPPRPPMPPGFPLPPRSTAASPQPRPAPAPAPATAPAATPRPAAPAASTPPTKTTPQPSRPETPRRFRPNARDAEQRAKAKNTPRRIYPPGKGPRDLGPMEERIAEAQRGSPQEAAAFWKGKKGQDLLRDLFQRAKRI